MLNKCFCVFADNFNTHRTWQAAVKVSIHIKENAAPDQYTKTSVDCVAVLCWPRRLTYIRRSQKKRLWQCQRALSTGTKRSSANWIGWIMDMSSAMHSIVAINVHVSIDGHWNNASTSSPTTASALTSGEVKSRFGERLASHTDNDQQAARTHGYLPVIPCNTAWSIPTQLPDEFSHRTSVVRRRTTYKLQQYSGKCQNT